MYRYNTPPDYLVYIYSNPLSMLACLCTLLYRSNARHSARPIKLRKIGRPVKLRLRIKLPQTSSKTETAQDCSRLCTSLGGVPVIGMHISVFVRPVRQ